ncbi:MAG: 23S rRNA (uracil(1939)-C(5))-methyltransferase RlmD [Gomphosphaeria aponina SAG 52.96 = DSM 107014]|uniref:23S rRNA (Uracil(1939)-C(5))-methyltransferase RlmD n=1 Tax=Gomphosphaeria aponina SAG 52.96 = DSM 107014 TaxID=1521640 RepID=A0A941JVI6_9CHRO|nr:23S rRNA (uracil(1939)-C(5))-methyltransferase RlmD [Gomphosphaeria aponina SAG 52.96 = DSM 107014]
MWQQGNQVEVEITDLSNSGDGVGRVDGRVVFVPNTVTGDRVLVRLVRIKPEYAFGKLIEIQHHSEHRIRPRCIVADKCGGCQWQHISDEYQLTAKRNLVIQALERIGGFNEPHVTPILETNTPLGYRNKATYPLGISATGQVQAGYYRQNSHKLVNLNQCPVQDPRLNPLLAQIKQDIQKRGWLIYHEEKLTIEEESSKSIPKPIIKSKSKPIKFQGESTPNTGELRHLSLRIARRSGEMLLTLVSTSKELKGIGDQAKTWLQRYPQLVGVALNYHPHPTNVIFGTETQLIAGKPLIRETFAGLHMQLLPHTFFQVNTEAAEALLAGIIAQLDLQGNELLVDAYCGVGTFTLPLAQRVKQAIGIEVQRASVEQGKINAQLNKISNVEFKLGTVETWLPQLGAADIVLLDPPRAGCDRIVINTLLEIKPPRIVYISCQPTTLARDLKLLCENGSYELISVMPADFFPQTAHVECAALVQLN